MVVSIFLYMRGYKGVKNMNRNSFVKMFWKSDVEMLLNDWNIALELINKNNLDKYKVEFKNINKLAKKLSSFELSLINYEILDNPIEQLISKSLVISLYSSLEECMLKLIPAIESKSNIEYATYKANQKEHKLSGIDKAISYIEAFSNIKFEENLSKDIE